MTARRLAIGALALALTGGMGACSSCRREAKVPDAVWREAVAAFHTGVAALQTSQEPLARQKFERVTTIVPQEPAAWANLGLLSLRQQDTEASRRQLARAAELAPTSAAIASLQGLAESRSGDPAAAIRHWRRALQLDPSDLKTAFALGQELAREGTDASDADAQRVLTSLVDRSGNLAARLELARLAAKRNDANALRLAIAPLTEASQRWPPELREQLASVQQAATGDARAAATPVTFLKNVLLRLPEYRAAVAAVSTPLEAVGEPLVRLLALENPAPRAAPADDALRFSVEPAERDALWAGAFSARGEGVTALLSVSAPGVAVGGSDVAIVAGPQRGLTVGRDALGQSRGSRRPGLRLRDRPGRRRCHRRPRTAAGARRRIHRCHEPDVAAIGGHVDACCGCVARRHRSRRRSRPRGRAGVRRPGRASQQQRRHLRRHLSIPRRRLAA